MSAIPYICQCGHHENFHFQSMTGIRICRPCLQVNGRCSPAIPPLLAHADHHINTEKLSEAIRIIQEQEYECWQQNTEGSFVEIAAVIVERLLRPWPAEFQTKGYWEERQNWFDQASAQEIAGVYLSPVIG